MKIRTGFVSNSSSSCFIIGLSRKSTLKGIKIIFRQLIAYAQEYKPSILELLPQGVSEDTIAQIIFDGLHNMPQYVYDMKGKELKELDVKDLWKRNVYRGYNRMVDKEFFPYYLSLSILYKTVDDIAGFLRELSPLNLPYFLSHYIGVT